MTSSELIPVQIPAEFVKLAGEWYSGMDKLYAIASTSGLKMGTRRPWDGVECRPMTDHEWHWSLWLDLVGDLNACISPNAEGYPADHADYPALIRFRDFARETRDRLAREYGIES